jgi:trehalose/maltose hydrolase-like predicted phosphorylase
MPTIPYPVSAWEIAEHAVAAESVFAVSNGHLRLRGTPEEGPDEYTTVVDNNAYTNLMARENLSDAAAVLDWLAAQDRPAYAELVEATGITDATTR